MSTNTTTTTSSNVANCSEFRPHQLRPDKCRNCFGDSKQHQQAAADDNGANETSHATTINQQEDQKTPICLDCSKKDAEIGNLRGELEQWQTRCRTAEEENERLREELHSMEKEMEEMHDTFKEEESEQFEQLKQELDGAMKNCKILQIRLNKSERQYAQLEQIKSMLERQLEERSEPIQANDGNQSNATSQQQQQQTNNFAQMGPDSVKLSTREYDQLLRDLNDTIEREKDLQEQMKYSQEEAQLKGERLQAVELENEVLLGRINKLTLTNSRLRSSLPSVQHQQQQQHQQTPTNSEQQQQQVELRDSLEQNEQLKLALEVAQSECQRLKSKVQELGNLLESKEAQVRELEASTSRQQASGSQDQSSSPQGNSSRSTELECRQLRARLVHSERDCRQLKAQLELFASSGGSSSSVNSTSTSSAGARRAMSGLRSQSVESPGQISNECQSSRCQETFRRLEDQCKSLRARNGDLETRLQRFRESESHSQQFESSHMESDLLEKLKKQLDTSENELAKARSRLVELDLECGRAQRQYKRLLSSLESCGSGEVQLITRKSKLLPGESLRDTMSRQELRQAIVDLESDLEEMTNLVRAKDCLIKEMHELQGHNKSPLSANAPGDDPKEEQLKSLRRLIDQERLLSDNLKLDVANLEQAKHELETNRRMLERERVCIEEELDKLRQLTVELRNELEENERDKLIAQNKSRELNESLERVRIELHQVKNSHHQVGQSKGSATATSSTSADLLLMARDLSEAKVKNGFLMRQLEMAREDTAKQLDELRESGEAQLRRAVELAQLEVRERQLNELQQLRDELSDLKQKLANLQRQLARQEEETNQEKDKVRSMERDWRRDKSQWQQQREQLDGQLTIERRSNEFKLKEAEGLIRDKERALIGIQERCVQMERDLKRAQNKSHNLEEDYESRLKQLQRELDVKTKQFNELSNDSRKREGDYYEINRRLTSEKSTLTETLETIRKSYDEKLAELKQLKEMFKARQEQTLKERQNNQERLEMLSNKLDQLAEFESQSKLSKQRLELVEKQLESARRDLQQLREDKSRLKSRCDELEKRELIARTSTISGAGSGLLRPFGRTSSPGRGESPKRSDTTTNNQTDSQQTIERLSSKINDQRHLINMLRQQLNESQLEVKQMKLIQASERNKWQTRVAVLTSKLNECEEKLAFETSLMAHNPDLLDQMRHRLDSSWSRERQTTLELIQQQQSQIELLSKDLKKVSQAHDLLRLHSKQLEAHNNKLSKKLIEYQQQQQLPSNLINTSTSEMSHRLARLEAERHSLAIQNAKLSQEMQPFVEIVGKIVSSLDAPESGQVAVVEQSRPLSSDSTNRPLRAPQSRRQSDDSELSLYGEQPAPLPAHLQADQHQRQQSRLARMLVGRPSPSGSSQGASSLPEDKTRPRKTLKRVRVKCSSLGITTNEKKQLKSQLKLLSDALAAGQQDGAPPTWRADGPQNVRAGSETSTRSSPAGLQPAGRGGSQPSHSSSGFGQHQSNHQQVGAVNRGVHWQLANTNTLGRPADLDSERSWSAEPSGQQRPTTGLDSYRRFPQATPSSGGHLIGSSLTDYESESSLASDYSFSTSTTTAKLAARPNRSSSSRPSGAESDSGLPSSASGGGVAAASRSRRPKGFKSRLTSTLRNIGRSITGFGSDSEGASDEPRRRGLKVRLADQSGGGDDNEGSLASSTSSLSPGHVREIRV